jgi:hypothetical protein
MVTASYTHGYRPNPRLSANQVADYLSASPTHRRRIISEAKYPTIVPVRYEDARTAVARHLADNRVSSNILSDALNSLQRKSDRSDLSPWKHQNHKLCVEAIGAFQETESKMGLGGIYFKAPPNSIASKLKISGVSISVSIDLLTQKPAGPGKHLIGGAVLVFSKTGGPDKNIGARCQAIALLVHEFLKQYFGDKQKIDPTLCMAADIFGGKVYRAKIQHKQLLKTIQISCEEVAIIWPTIKPPAKYFGPPIPSAA